MAKAMKAGKGSGKAKGVRAPRAPSANAPKERLTLDERNNEEAGGYQYLPKSMPKGK